MMTKGKSRFSYVLVGMGLGAVAGWLLAPGAAEEMWKYLRERSHRGLDTLIKQAGRIRESAGVVVKKSKDFIGSPRGSAKNIQETERQAYEEHRRENPGG